MVGCYCCVFGCTNNSKKDGDKSFFMFPAEDERKILWLQKIGREDLIDKFKNYKGAQRVCSDHFGEDSFIRTYKRNLKKDADPKVKLPSAERIQDLVGGSSSASIYNTVPECATSFHDSSPGVDWCSNQSTPIQTERIETNEECDFSAQTSLKLSSNTPRKQIFRKNLYHSQKIISSVEQERDKPMTLVNFFEGCDKSANVIICHAGDQYKESKNGKLRLSSDILIPESTNAMIQELMMDMHELSDKIQNFYPVLIGRQFTLCFKGEDGDKCEYIFTSASDTRRKGERHSGSRCDECKANIVGFRYKCVTCPDYDLCSACEALGIHDQHVMMRIAKPLKFKQARAMVQRCCDELSAGDISATVDKSVGRTSGLDPDNSSLENIVEARTSKETSSNKSETSQERPSIKPLFVKNDSPSNAKASIKDGTDGKLKKRNEDRKRKAEASEDEEEMSQTVKEEADDLDLASYYNSFIDTVSEPFVAIDDVKIEDPDPLETEETVKVEQPTEADPSSWSADTEPGTAAGSSGASSSQEDAPSVCLTYTHKRKKYSDPN